MSRATLPSVILIAFLLAGCLAQEETPALNASEGVEEPPPTSDAAASEEPEALVVLHEEFEGTMTNFANACAVPAGQCASTPTRSASVGARIDHEGTLVNVTAELRWVAAGAATQTLGLMIMTCDEETGACADHGQVEGPSPLSLSADALDAPENRTLYVHAFQPTQNQASSPVILYYEFDQPFHLALHGARRVAADEA